MVVGWRAMGFWAPILTGALAAGAAPGEEIQPHTAVYDLSLSRVEPNVSMLSAQGRLMFEIAGAVCEGFTVNSRFATRTVDREGETHVNDLRLTTHETVEAPSLDFVSQTVVGDEVTSMVAGTATSRAEGTVVELTEPKSGTVELSRAIFPTQHTLLILQAAEEGERVLEAPVFDGGGEADEVYSTLTLIGPATKGLPGATPGEREALGAIEGADELDAHRLVISYFSQTESAETGGEGVPAYVISFTMLSNGVSYNATFDYGSFEFAGRLTELELGEKIACGAAPAATAPARGGPADAEPGAGAPDAAEPSGAEAQ